MANGTKLSDLGLTSADLTAIGKLSEKGLSADEIADAIKKAHDIQSSASEIDGSVNNKYNFIFGDNLYSYSNRKIFTDISRWSNHIPGTNTVFEQSELNTKYSTNTIKIGNLESGDTSLFSKNISIDSPINLTDAKSITFWVFVDGELVQDTKYASNFGQMLFTIGDNNNSTFQYGANLFGVAGASFGRGWNNISISLSDFTIALKGVLDLANIQTFQLRQDKSADSLNTYMYLDSVFINYNLPTTPICITLDDSNKEQYEMVNIMNKYGIPCTLNVIPEYIDNNEVYQNSLNLQELHDIYCKGNDICCHHQDIAAFALDETKVLAVRDWIKNNGFTRNNSYLYGSYPNGATNQNLIDYLKLNGFQGFRTDSGRNRDDSQNAESTRGLTTREEILNGGIADAFRIVGKNCNSFSYATTEIQKAIEHGAGMVILSHSFSEIGGKAEWELLAKYLKEKVDEGVVECLTFPQFVKKYS